MSETERQTGAAAEVDGKRAVDVETDGVVESDMSLASGVDAVVRYLREARLFDFTGYKRGTLTRRIDRRMQQVGIDHYEAYVDYLEVHPEEFEVLFNTILINVTGFFRDSDTWDIIKQTVIPDITSRQDTPVRVWSAGCATGQEAYSTVMLLGEVLGIDALRERVKVYATDLDDEALEYARQATYTSKEVEGIPPDLLEKYFERHGTGYTFDGDLRRSVIFGRHDLLRDAPISRTNFLLCRNTLMYFNAEMQRQLINRLHFSLADHGFLVLGKVEMLNQPELFAPVEAKHRLFQKVSHASLREQLLAMAGQGTAGADAEDDRIVEMAFEHRASPEILLDAAGIVLGINARARNLFGVGADAVGLPFQDLEVSYRPVELRSRIDEVLAEGRVVELDEVSRWTPSGDLTFLDVKLVPISVGQQHRGVVITFVDVTRHRQLQEELEQTHRELEVAYEEVQSTNEELETTNEELQSTIEELETTNEELQSTNEELETMNEELQSTNEELQAANEELRDRTAEINETNAYIESVLASLDSSVIVVDRELQVRVWNGLSFDMWGLHPDEVEGRALPGLDIGFPVDALNAPIRACLTGDGGAEVHTLDALSRRGTTMRCRARVAPLMGSGGAIEGAIVLISEEPQNGSFS
jgi:two-component system CheB/CheR fusion protein